MNIFISIKLKIYVKDKVLKKILLTKTDTQKHRNINSPISTKEIEIIRKKSSP